MHYQDTCPYCQKSPPENEMSFLKVAGLFLAAFYGGITGLYWAMGSHTLSDVVYNQVMFLYHLMGRVF